jgi:hypothetical protein
VAIEEGDRVETRVCGDIRPNGFGGAGAGEAGHKAKGKQGRAHAVILCKHWFQKGIRCAPCDGSLAA